MKSENIQKTKCLPEFFRSGNNFGTNNNFYSLIDIC